MTEVAAECLGAGQTLTTRLFECRACLGQGTSRIWAMPLTVRRDPLLVRSRKRSRGELFQELATRVRENQQPRNPLARSRIRQSARAESADQIGIRLYRILDASQRRSRQAFKPTRPSSALRNSAIFAASFGRPVSVSNASRNRGSENTPRMSAP